MGCKDRATARYARGLDANQVAGPGKPLDSKLQVIGAAAMGLASSKDRPERAEKPAACEAGLLPFRARLGESAAARFVTLFRRREVPAGCALAREGDDLPELMILDHGLVALYRTKPGQGEQMVGWCFPGDLLAAATAQECAPVTARAPVPSTFWAAPWESLDRFARKQPEVHRCLLDLAERSMARMRAHLLVVLAKSKLERLAAFLLEIRDQEAAPGGKAERVELAMDREVIAQYLGLTVESVSRAFTALKDRGLIEMTDPRHILLSDLAGLTALAKGEGEAVS